MFGDDDPEGDSHHYEPEDEELEHPQPTEIQQVVSFNFITCLKNNLSFRVAYKEHVVESPKSSREVGV